MNILKNIIERLNQKLDASNIFGAIYGLAEPAPDNPKQFFVYEGSGQGKPVTDYDKTQGTAFWRFRSAVTMRQTEVLRPVGCQEMYVATYPLRCYAFIRKSSMPCDSNAVEGWVMDMFWKYVSGKDTALRNSLGVTDVFFRPVSVTLNTPDLPNSIEWIHAYFDLDVEVTAKAIESCYDECGVNPIPLPNGQCPPINRVQSVTGLDTDNTDPSNPIVKISVDGITITGEGTPSDPLVAVGGGGGGVSVRTQDEGTTIAAVTNTLNFTGAGVTASLASAGNVTVNIPAASGGAVDSVNGQTGAVVLDTDDISDTTTNRYTNDTDIARLANTSGTNTGDQDLSGLVPYTGATGDVDLGANIISAESVRVTGTNGAGNIHLRHQASNPTATGQSTSIFADSNGDVKIKNDGLSYATFKTSEITADRVYEFPNNSGTVALTSDVQVYTEGTGIDITSNVITNTAPDQTVVLNEGTGIEVTGTYPNFTIANTVNGIVRSEYTASNAASIDVPIPAGYSHHKIIMVGITAGTANSELWHRVGIGAPSVIQSGAGAYLHYRILGGSSTALALTGSAADTKMVLIGAAMPTGSSGQALNGNYTLYNPDGTTLKKQFNGNMSTFFNSGLFVGGTIHSTYNATDAVTSIRFQCSTGNISGKIIIESYL